MQFYKINLLYTNVVESKYLEFAVTKFKYTKLGVFILKS